MLRSLVLVFFASVLSVNAIAQSDRASLEKVGDDCRKKSDWNCVVENSTKLLNLVPGDATYRASRGQAYFELNKFEEADTDIFGAIVAAGKQVPFLQHLYGRINIAKGDRKSAITYFNAAASVANDPQHAIYQTALDMSKDPSKTDQDLREKYSSFNCRGAYNVDREGYAKDGVTVPTSLVKEQSISVLRQFLPCRFDLNRQNSDGSTALIYVSVLSRDQEAFVQELVKYGADPNFADPASGITALIMAVSAKPDKPEIVRALLNAGASPKAKDQDGHDPLFYAKTNGLAESINLIQAALDKLPKAK
jgi:tetratricopeptide (TPR) repeat protein